MASLNPGSIVHAFLLLLLCFQPLCVLSHELLPISQPRTNTPSPIASNYVVSVDYAAKPLRFPTPDLWYSAILNSLPTEVPGLRPEVIFTYQHAMHGFAAKSLTSHQAMLLKEYPGVFLVLPDARLRLMWRQWKKENEASRLQT